MLMCISLYYTVKFVIIYNFLTNTAYFINIQAAWLAENKYFDATLHYSECTQSAQTSATATKFPSAFFPQQ